MVTEYSKKNLYLVRSISFDCLHVRRWAEVFPSLLNITLITVLCVEPSRTKLYSMEDEDSRTVWVGNLDSDNTTEEILYELFLQVNIEPKLLIFALVG